MNLLVMVLADYQVHCKNLQLKHRNQTTLNRDYKGINKEEVQLGPPMIVPKPAISHSNPSQILQLYARDFNDLRTENSLKK